MRRGGLLLVALTAALLLGTAPALAAKGNGGGVPTAGALLGPSGNPTLLKADTITYDTDTKFVTAEGHVEVDHNDRILTSDRLTYDQDKDVVVAEGHVVMMTPDGNVVFTPRAVLSNEMKDAVLDGFRALIGKYGRLAAVQATRKDATITTMHQAIFTPCKICNQPGQRTPLWDVKAVRAVYDQNTHRIVYHDATLEMFGIPVAYTPYFSQADPTVKRTTGILSPDLGSSSTLGSFIKIPIYVSLSDSEDFTLSPLFSTHGGELVEGEYRERWNNGGMWLQAAVANNPRGGITGHEDQTYSSLFGSGRVPVVGNMWKLGYDFQLTSNPTFLDRYNLYNKDDQLFNDLFLTGQAGRSRFAITGYFFQSLIGRCNTIICPVVPPPGQTTSPLFIPNGQIPLVLPMIEYNYIPEGTVAGGTFRFDVNTVSISRQTGPDDQRATAEARWDLPLVSGNGQLFTLRFDARGDVYHTTNNDIIDFPNIPLDSHTITRGLPYAGFDWRWPFVSSGGGRTSYIIEPIVQGIFAPYGGNPKGIPNEDSADIELDDNDVFSFNRMPGYDIVETGPRANVGFRTEALFPSGSVELQLGDVLRLKPDPIFTPDTGLAGKYSDAVERFTIKLPPHFSFTHRMDVDSSTGNIRRNEVDFNGSYGHSSAEISYVRLPEDEAVVNDEAREEVNAQATVGLFDHWLAFAGARRDLANSQMLDDEFGLGYNDECLGVSLSYRRQYTRDRDVPPSTSILLGFHLWTGDQSDEEHENQLFPRQLFSSTIL